MIRDKSAALGIIIFVSLMGIHLLVFADYNYLHATGGNDEIYFGYCPACDNGAPALRVCRVIRPQDREASVVEHKVTMDTGTLVMFGGNGNDLIKAVHEKSIEGCAFQNFKNLTYSKVEIRGGPGHDILIGTYGEQHLYGESGNDLLAGGPDDDVLRGGQNDDYLDGGLGHDKLYGQQDHDVLVRASGKDEIYGGTGIDTFRCRFYDLPKADHDIRCDENTNCFDTTKVFNVANAHNLREPEVSNPYTHWAAMTFFNQEIGSFFHHLTTSNSEQLMLDRTEGASILLDSKSNEPIAVTHKQFYWTCGPAALNIVFEHLGLADRNRRTSGLRDLDQEHLDTVDLGYHLSQEHIMYECYHRYRQIDEPGWDADRGKFMNSNGELQTTLASSPDHEGHWYEISYDIGNFTHDSAKRTNSARIENWLKFGAGCGHLNHITDKGLPYVANKYPRWDIPDGYPVSTAIFGVDPTFTSLQHLKAVIKGYIDHSIPLAVGIENGGHYNTIIGYWERNDGFWIYTAEPLDGWGRTCWAKPMRWRKIKINTNVLLGGNDFLVSLFLFGHGTSCYDHGWAQQIDQNPSYVPTLCNYLKFWDGESWGGSDYVPLLDDVDGDGKTDRVLYHQTSGDWGCLISNGGRCQWDGQDWGGYEYIPLLSDVNGDGKADRVLYRESDGDWGCWITDGGRCPWDGQAWGGSEYIPLLGDLNDDGKADRVLYRESDGDWGCRLTNGGKCLWDRHRWGVSNYEPLMGDVNGDGKADRVLYRASDGDWGCWITGGYKCSWDGLKYGDFNYLSLLGDVDGDGKADRVLYRTSDGDWGCQISNGDKCSWDGHDWGGSGYKPYLGNIGGSKADRIIYRPTDGNWGIRIRRNMMLE